jgi:hypothetical protein
MRGRHAILVMDRSASMQTLEAGKSRWELARDRALEIVRGLGADDSVTIVAAGSRAEILASAEGNRQRLEAILRALSPADTPDAMAPAIQLALGLLGGQGETKGDAATELHIYTDRSSESLGLGKRPPSANVHVERMGSAKANAGITSISIHRNLFSVPPRVSAYVTVENLSGDSFDGRLKAMAEGKEIASLPIALKPGAAYTTQVGENLPTGIVEIALEPMDALAVDNRAYLLLPDKKTVRIALFTRDAKCAEQFQGLAAAVPHLALEVLNPAAYAATDMTPYGVAIFHGCEPEKEPGTNLLMICPPVESGIVDVADDWVSGVSFLDWDENHPLGENLRGLQNVPLGGSRVLRTPSWAKPVVISATATGDIPLVTCGDYGGRRAVVMSFDLPEIELKKERSLPALILLLNAVKWLSEDDRDQIETGEPYETLVPETGRLARKGDQASGGGGVSYTVIDPRGGEERAPAGKGGSLVFADTDYAGRYLLTGAGGEKTFVANLCSQLESDLRADVRGEDRAAVADVVAVGAARRKPPDRSAIFLSLAVLILLVEWLLWSMGRRSARPAPAGEPME